MPTRKFVPKKKESKWKARFRKGRQALKTSAQIATDVAKLSASVAYLGSRLNVEKKYLDRDVVNGNFAQVYASSTGHNHGIYMIDVTPQIAQGTDSDQRIGNSLKLTGMTFPIQFDGNTRTISQRKIKVLLLRVNASNNSVTATDALNDFLDPNPINGILDMNSPRAYRKHVNDGVRLIRSKVYTLPAVKVTAHADDDNADEAEKSSFMAKFNVKLNDILRYADSSHSTPDGVRYYMYFMADKGCVSPEGVNSTLDVPIVSHSTGVGFKLGQRSWWVDN